MRILGDYDDGIARCKCLRGGRKRKESVTIHIGIRQHTNAQGKVSLMLVFIIVIGGGIGYRYGCADKDILEANKIEHGGNDNE